MKPHLESGKQLVAEIFVRDIRRWTGFYRRLGFRLIREKSDFVGLAFSAAGLARISTAVTPVLLIELVGRSRTTATGLFGASNQLGTFGGASIGALMLAVGGFPMMGFF